MFGVLGDEGLGLRNSGSKDEGLAEGMNKGLGRWGWCRLPVGSR